MYYCASGPIHIHAIQRSSRSPICIAEHVYGICKMPNGQLSVSSLRVTRGLSNNVLCSCQKTALLISVSIHEGYSLLQIKHRPSATV